MESIHVTRKYSAFSSFGRWNPMYLVLNSKIFYLLSYKFIWTSIPYHGLLLSFIHLATLNQLLSAPYFFSDAQPISQSLEFKILVSSLCVFLFFHIFYLPGHQACEILTFMSLFFSPSSIVVQTLPQIQHFPNYIQRTSVWGNINSFCSRISLPNALSHPCNWTISFLKTRIKSYTFFIPA